MVGEDYCRHTALYLYLSSRMTAEEVVLDGTVREMQDDVRQQGLENSIESHRAKINNCNFFI